MKGKNLKLSTPKTWRLLNLDENILNTQQRLDILHYPTGKNAKKLENDKKPVILNSDFSLFMEYAPKSYAKAVGRSNEWVPSELDTLPNETGENSFKSYTGIISRIELVEVLKRIRNIQGDKLSIQEYEYAVWMFEAADTSMQLENWEIAYRCSVDLLRRFPNFSLAYWKAGISLLMLNLIESGNLVDTQHENSIDEHNTRSSRSSSTEQKRSSIESEHKKNITVDSKTIMEACRFFKCAVKIEPFNRALHGLIDMTLRLATGVCIPKENIYRDVALYPRSTGDAIALALIQDSMSTYSQN